MFKNKKNIFCLVLCSIIMTQGIAQDKIDKLDDVIVVSQKIEENIKDVPISITFFNEFEIEDAGINNIADIGEYTPSFTMFSNGTRGASTPSMRGIHAEIQSYQLSTGLYIDGVPSLLNVGFDTIINDIQSIEVLKGPQSTLYGKNAQAGAIVIRTKQPNNEFEGKVSLGVGSDNKRTLEAKISTPLIENKLYLSIFANHDEKDGFLKHKASGEIIDNRKSDYIKANLRATPSDDLDISLVLSKLQYDDGASRMNEINAQNRRILDVDLIGSNNSKQEIASLNIKYNLSKDTTFQSISAINRLSEDIIFDGDSTNLPVFHTHRNSVYTSMLQEFRISSKSDNFKYVIGTDFTKAKNDSKVKVINYNADTFALGEDTSVGIFFNSTYDFNDKLSIVSGLRYDKEKKEFNSPANIFYNSFKKSQTYSALSPKIGMNYKFSDSNMMYANISKGYRPGGFNTNAPTGSAKTYEEENLISYEIGSKLNFLDNKLSVNTSAYLMKISDMQVQEAITSTTLLSTNAAEATSKGIELELRYILLPQLELYTSFGINNTKFDDFENNIYDPITEIQIGTINYKGNYNPNAPKYNYNIGAQYRSSDGYFVRVDLNGHGKSYFDKANKFSKDAYQLVNTKIGYETNNFDIYLYGKNLFDKQYDSVGYFDGQYTILSEPREIGVKLTYRF